MNLREIKSRIDGESSCQEPRTLLATLTKQEGIISQMANPIHILPDDLPQALNKFWSKVNKSPGQGPQGECWEWRLRIKRPYRYGSFSFSGKKYRAHRWIWTAINGAIPDDFQVCHKCDNPPCVRLDHLFIGTMTDNMRDCVAKGRHGMMNHPELSYFSRHPVYPLIGEKHASAKLLDSQIPEIHQMLKYMNIAQIAQSLNVSETAIYRIVRGERWKHVQREGGNPITMELFAIGQLVEWTSFSRGYIKTRQGTIVALVPPDDGKTEKDLLHVSNVLGGRVCTCSIKDIPFILSRPHWSYLIEVQHQEGYKPSIYWPRISAIKVIETARDAVRKALGDNNE